MNLTEKNEIKDFGNWSKSSKLRIFNFFLLRTFKKYFLILAPKIEIYLKCIVLLKLNILTKSRLFGTKIQSLMLIIENISSNFGAKIQITLKVKFFQNLYFTSIF